MCRLLSGLRIAGLKFSPGTSKAEQIRVCVIHICVPGFRSGTSSSGSGLLNLEGLNLDLEVRLYPLLPYKICQTRFPSTKEYYSNAGCLVTKRRQEYEGCMTPSGMLVRLLIKVSVI